MTDRHKYEYPVDLLQPSAATYVVQIVDEGKRVLESGAGKFGKAVTLRVLHAKLGAA